MNNAIIHYNESTELNDLSVDKPYIVAIDSSLISTHSIEVPKMSFSKAKKAIPFLLEDTLLDDIETLDFFIQKTADEKCLDVIVIKKHTVDELKKKVQNAKLDVSKYIVDFMLLPSEKDKVYYSEAEQDVLFRYGDFLGGKTNQETFKQLFTDKDQIPAEKTDIKHAKNINLLNIDWALNWEEKLYKWRVSIIVLLLIMLLSPIQLILDNRHLTKSIETQLNTNETYFKTLFPEVKRIVDLHAQVKQKLNTLSVKGVQSDSDLLAKIQSEIKTNTTQIKRLQFSNQTLKVEQ